MDPQTTRQPIQPAAVPLTDLKPGDRGVVCETKAVAADDADLIRAMGLREDCTLRVCRTGSPCIVALETPSGGGCRIGLSRDVAGSIMITVAGQNTAGQNTGSEVGMAGMAGTAAGQ